MKKTKKNMRIEPEYLSNSPKTYGIVYKDSAKVINYSDSPMYFRSKDIAVRWMHNLSPIFCDSELEVIQFEPTAEEKRNKEVIKDLAHNLSKKKRSIPRMAKNSKIRQSKWISHLKKEHKKYKEEIESKKLREKKQKEELNEEECF